MTERFTQVEFGGQQVTVPAGGYYDRFRMNPDLDEVARDLAAGGVDFFRRIPKQLVQSRVGPIWAPNFYYRSSSVQLLFLAPVDRLRAMLPEPLEPLKGFPGRGLVALTFFSYAVCDNDPYDEVSIAVVVRRPGARGAHSLELLDAMRRRSFHAHVLALPVTTEIARVRGYMAINFPNGSRRSMCASATRSKPALEPAKGRPTLRSSRRAPSSGRCRRNRIWRQTPCFTASTGVGRGQSCARICYPTRSASFLAMSD